MVAYASILLLLVLGFSAVIYEQNRLQRIRTVASECMASLSGQEPPTEGDYVVLHRLADSGAAIHTRFIEQLFADPNNAARLQMKFPYLLHAIVGLDVQKNGQIKVLLSKYGRIPAEDRPINVAVAEFGAMLVGDDAEFDKMVAENVLAAMEKTIYTDDATMGGSTKKREHRVTLTTFGNALGSLGEKLPEEQAVAGAQQIVAAMEKTTDPYVLSSLGSELSGFGKKLPRKQALAGAKKIVAAIVSWGRYVEG